MKKLKILELTNFSAGICGVWQRAKQESLELSKKGYQVRVFSSNAVKGSDEITSCDDSIEGIKIRRFPFKKIGGESYMSWDSERLRKEIQDYHPDVIIAHSYRHKHTHIALDTGKKIGAKIFLVTHAPFSGIQRSFLAKLYVKLFDLFVGKRRLKQFDRIIAITHWEIPYLEKLGIKKEKISYIPNGIPEEFFKKKTKKGKSILFLGRISPVKNLEVLIKSVNKIKIDVDIVGPAEQEYGQKLKEMAKNSSILNVKFLPPVYELGKKIDLIDKHEIFVLPSKTESMPQSLIEAMARGKLVVSSKTPGGKEIIANNQNGFLFEIGNSRELAELLKKIINMPETEKNKIRKSAIKTAQQFSWKKIISDLEGLF